MNPEGYDAVIRLFNIYYPTRILILAVGEVLIVCTSFVLGALLRLGEDSMSVLAYQHGFYKILGVTAIVLLCLDYFDLYDSHRLPSSYETYFRLLVVLSLLSFLLAGIGILFPGFMLGNQTFVFGLLILTLALFGWRSIYAWVIRQPFLRERVYVLGRGDRANFLVGALRDRPELGMDVVGWSRSAGGDSPTREVLAVDLLEKAKNRGVDRIIVTMGDRRGTMPVRELLELRLRGIKVEDAAGLIEKITGKIEIGGLLPSWLIFSEGFRLNFWLFLIRRLSSIIVAVTLLVLLLPFIPLIALAVKLSSPGPVFYRQNRVGRNGEIFTCCKFRTMLWNSEAETGPAWAGSDDPRITRVGRWLRDTRLDEVPQLWNVLRGDMGFVGPRPERPEFVEWLSREIPYYHLRHVIRPGITGWAQVCYRYGASLEESMEKLKYDLYYIKHMCLSLDLVVIFRSVKIVLLRRGAR